MRCPLTWSAGNTLSVVSWVMGTANRMKGRAVVILSVDATHLLMASEDNDAVGMKAVPQTPQGPQGLTCVLYEPSAKYSSSTADTLKLYHHIPGLGCPFDIWQQTWERHERRGPHSGESSIWLHHPCLLRVPIVGRNQYGYITPVFSGSP